MKRSKYLPIMLAAVLAFTGCSKPEIKPTRQLSWVDCLNQLNDYAQPALLDPVNLTFFSSFDRSGGNNDFNNFAGPGKEPGWYVMADIKGPGCIRRFWMTGNDLGHPIRIYIDGEKKPRIDTTIDELFGQKIPWTAPLAHYINMCFFSYVPITYNRSIRFEVKEPNVHPLWGPRRLFFQIAAETFPSDTGVESYPVTFTDEQLSAVSAVAAKWADAIDNRDIPLPTDADKTVIEPAAKKVLWEQAGPGIVQAMHINVQPAQSTEWNARQRTTLMNDIVLRVFYDNATVPSIEAPLGFFFANAWGKRAYGSWWFTSGPKGYTCRLPMPFQSGIRIELENTAALPVAVQLSTEVKTEAVNGDGYLHAEYRRSNPDTGNHLVTRVNGKGKYIGCFLGVTGLGNSWWILEGDERMWVDGNTTPVWHGTGLEDYFNGGWYYRGSGFGALNANFDRAPFRVAQFRHQHPDPVSFNTFFQMEFERMNDEQTGTPVKGIFESVAYWYQEKPSGVFALSTNPADRKPVEHPNFQPTFMLQLVELERGNDFEAALKAVEEYLERFPNSEEAAVYRLRHLEYRRLLGQNITAEEMAPFLDGSNGPSAQEQAKLLDWFYGGDNRALVGLSVNGKGRLYLDGKPILGGDHPYFLFVTGVELSEGSHQLAAQVEWQRQDPWLQAGIRTKSGVGGTGPGTPATLKVEGEWKTQPLAALDWHKTGIREIPRGVPDAPYLGGIANAFVLLQSKTYPVTALNWSYYRGTAYFREDVQVPTGVKENFSRSMTGLQE